MTDPIPQEPEDTGESLFKLFGSFGLQLKTVGQQLEGLSSTLQTRLARLPNYQSAEGQMTNFTGTATIDFGAPQPGRKWILRLWGVFTPGMVANAGVPVLYVGSYLPASPVLTNARWFYPSSPNVKNWTSDVITVLPNQHLWVQVTSAPAASTIAHIVAFDDQPMSSERASLAVG